MMGTSVDLNIEDQGWTLDISDREREWTYEFSRLVGAVW